MFTGRLTVVEHVYHQIQGDAPTSIEAKYSTPLESDEQVYTRQTIATETPEQLDIGWIKDWQLLIIENNAGKNLQKIPTEEQKQDIAQRVIQITSGDTPIALIYPGTSARFCPADLKSLDVRCLHGSARYVLHIIPS